MSNPFDPLSPGLHRLDSGLTYRAHPAGTPIEDWDPFFGRQLDVELMAFVWAADGRVLHAGVIVELNLQMAEVDPHTAEPTGGDAIGEWLCSRRMVPAPYGLRAGPPPPPAGPVGWSVRPQHSKSRPSGVYAPGPGGAPSGWVVASPLPPGRPPQWAPAAMAAGGRCTVFVTTRTQGLVHRYDDDFMDAVNVEADRGRLWAAQAWVIGALR